MDQKPPINALELRDVEYFKRGAWENPRFWNRLGGQPDLHGKKVLDLGCGHGSLCIDMAKAGATRVVGVDLNERLIRFAQQNLHQNYPELADRVLFYCIDIADLNEGEFDLMTSKDTFEHVMDLPKVLTEMRARLKSGGRLYAAIGPLWNSPFGDHDTIKRLIGVNLPWAHLVVPDRIVLNATAKRTGQPLQSYRDLGMNMLAFRDYKRIIYNSGFEVEFFQPNCSKHPVVRLFSLLRHLPIVGDYFVNNLYCILRKP
ncbi:MAG: class I SAM-dependent methyltransferase [Armatimonadetes bacterium]|jgi:SAM-dependent methyltransferase|nr:MAG: class I SAM-dependent methyltransferase [Armatimonadota bacterium]